MKNKTVNVPQQEIERQYAWMHYIQQENEGFFREHGRQPLARVRNFGCQMNEHDAEKLAGMLSEMGYALTDGDVPADLIIFNTCCVRENAEEKVFGHLGALKAQKRANPDMRIAVCGCMTEQPHVVEEIRRKYKHVDLVFGTHNLHRFPELLAKCTAEHTHVYEMSHTEGEVAEGMPILRSGSTKAWVTVMYGCNNFCSYCIVPYVRERTQPGQRRDCG